MAGSGSLSMQYLFSSPLLEIHEVSVTATGENIWKRSNDSIPLRPITFPAGTGFHVLSVRLQPGQGERQQTYQPTSPLLVYKPLSALDVFGLNYRWVCCWNTSAICNTLRTENCWTPASSESNQTRPGRLAVSAATSSAPRSCFQGQQGDGDWHSCCRLFLSHPPFNSAYYGSRKQRVNFFLSSYSVWIPQISCFHQTQGCSLKRVRCKEKLFW